MVNVKIKSKEVSTKASFVLTIKKLEKRIHYLNSTITKTIVIISVSKIAIIAIEVTFFTVII